MWSTLGAAVAMAEAGVLRPVGPRTVSRLIGHHRNLGVSPALLGAVSSERWPDQVAIVDDFGSLTYRKLDRQAEALAFTLMRDHQVGPGEAVAVMCRNHRDLVLGILAAGRVQANLLMVNTELPAAQLAPTLRQHAPRVLLHDADFSDRVAIPGLVTMTAGAAESDVARACRVEVPRTHRWPTVESTPSLVILTSGTTGTPRGVPRQPRSGDLLGTTASLLHRLRIRANRTIIVCPPAFHGLGLITLLLGLMTGSTVVIRSRFDAETVVDDVVQHGAETLVVVPVMIQRLLTVDGLHDKLAGVRAVLSGGAALSPTTAQTFVDRVGPVLFNGYGSSEVGIASLATPADLAESPGTVGRPVLGTSALVIDPATRRPAPVGVTGELFVSSPLGSGKYSAGESKAVVDGHLSSGDVGHLDKRGRLHVTGRADDMIVSGGENVFPQPVEDALLRHPGITEASVVGVPDSEYGQRLAAFVVAQPDVDVAAVRVALRSGLARYELPRSITVVDELPRTASGKVRKADLIEQAVTTSTGTGREER